MKSSTICQKLVHCDKDMRDIERCIVRELGGENHRCAFFRTVEYIRLRIATLYVPVKSAQFASYSDLSVVLTPTEQGPLVAVLRFSDKGHIDNNNNNECVLDAMETGMLRSEFKQPIGVIGQQKRARIEFLPK